MIVSFQVAALLAVAGAVCIGVVCSKTLTTGGQWLGAGLAALVGAVIGFLPAIPDWDKETAMTLTGYTLGAVPLIVIAMGLVSAAIFASFSAVLALIAGLIVRPRRPRPAQGGNPK